MSLLQVLITVWALGSHHPVTYMLPHQYTAQACRSAVNSLFAKRKPKSYSRMQIECVPAIGRDA